MAEHRSKFTIAVVDDDVGIVESLEGLLESADYGVYKFTSANALLESDCFAQVSCLISDINMPVMDGFALLQAVRERRPKLPIILITGYPQNVGRSPPIGEEHYRLFKKPFNGEELLTAVRDLLRDPRPGTTES